MIDFKSENTNPRNEKSEKKNSPFLFDKKNYILLLVSLLLVCLGFGLMMGGEGDSPTGFNPEIFSPQRIKYAPIIIIVGYIGMIFSIFYND
jgi:hypothetical protein